MTSSYDIILSGAGVGKSATIRAITMHAEKILLKAGDHPHKPRVLICAPTGKAASIINGITLHSAFSFKFGTDHTPLSDKKLATFRELLSDLKVIVVDEMSLLDSDMLFKIHKRLCEVFQTEDLFANKGVILVGDLLQLPPVKGSFIFNKPTNTHSASFNDAQPLWQSFEPHELVVNHRQGDSNKWAKILNELRVGNVTQEAKTLLETRVTTDPFLDQESMHVFYTNQEVADHNLQMLQNINEPLVQLVAYKRGPRGYYFKTTKHGTIDSTQLMDVLGLKVGARICIVFNINTIDGLVNGSLGTVLSFESNKHKKIEAIIIKFDDYSTGEQQRACYPILSQKYAYDNGTPIFRQELEYNITSKRGKGHAPKAKIVQFPMRLAWATTAHKMQGQTVKAGSKLIVHWNKKFQPGMAYVMLGRCERIEDLYIAGKLDFELIKCSPCALKEAEKISHAVKERSIQKAKSDLNTMQISCLNIRSFPGKINDLKCVDQIMKSDLICLCETWTEDGFYHEIDGFHGEFLNGGRGKGLAIFSKLNFNHIEKQVTDTFSAAFVKLGTLSCIFLYLSQNFDWLLLNSLFEKWIIEENHTIIAGDMNWHWQDLHPMKSYLLGKHFRQMVTRSTHEAGNIIDHAYVSQDLQNVEVSQYAVLFSDHDVVKITLGSE